MAGLQDTEEHLQIAAAVGNRADIESRIEWPDVGENAAPVGHVRPRAELARVDVKQILWSTIAVDLVGAGFEATAEAAIALEELLGLSLQLVGDHQAGDGHDLGLLGEDTGQGTDPVGVDDHIIVGVGQEVAAGLGDGAVAGPVEAGMGSQT